jgi:hypothetical protein
MRPLATHAALLITAALILPGCLERRLTITSEPPGATATVNGVEIGRTPVSASFVYYGDYDVELQHQGSEPLRARATAPAPLYEYAPIDLLASALPFTLSTDVKWHYKLQPELSTAQPRPQLEQGLRERADALRDRLR